MIESLFKNLNIQETWESIVLRVTSLLDLIRTQGMEVLAPFWDKVLDNPLASIITLLALIGLPYTLIKAKESNSEANDRLDQLMDEMKDFEFEKPLADLQEKFKSPSPEDSPSTNHEQEISNLSLEIDAADLNTEEGSGPRNLKSDSFAKHLTLDQEVTDNFLTGDSWNLQPETDDENPELSAFLEEDSAEEDSKDTKVSSPVEPGAQEAEYANLFFEDLPKKDDDDVLVSMAEKILSDAEISSSEPGVAEEAYADHDSDDLQTRMERTINKLRMKYSPPAETEEVTSEEIDADPVPSVSETEENPSSHEETKEDGNEDASHASPPMVAEDGDTPPPSPLPAPPDSNVGGQEDSLNKSDVITHLKSFQKKLEERFESEKNGLKKNSIDSPQEQAAFFRPIPKPAKKTSPSPDKTANQEYQESLESLIFLKDQKKPE